MNKGKVCPLMTHTEGAIFGNTGIATSDVPGLILKLEDVELLTSYE